MNELLEGKTSGDFNIMEQKVVSNDDHIRKRISRIKQNEVHKRIYDVVLVMLFAPIVLILVALLGVLIRLDSSGPVFYRQKRLGRGQNPFVMLKLRTMRNDHMEDNPLDTSIDLSRVTRVGRWLRKTRLDELPQLWNVFVGDMSIVGPRPERVELTQIYAQHIEGYHERHRMRPGITGLAQLRQGYTTTMDETRIKLVWDLCYIDRHSLWYDAVILVQTLRSLFVGIGER